MPLVVSSRNAWG